MKIQMILVVLVCAIGLSGCETINGAWHDVFGLNNASSQSQIQQASAAR